MININIENEPEQKIVYNDNDVLLLRNDREVCLGIITKRYYEEPHKCYYDLTMLIQNSNDNYINRWTNEKLTIEELISEVQESYIITKLQSDQYEININIK